MADDKKTAESIKAETNKETPQAEAVPEIATAIPVKPDTKEPIKPTEFTAAAKHTVKFIAPLKRGEVLISRIDKDGNEIAGQQFVTSQQTAEKYYTETTKFIIKKKVN